MKNLLNINLYENNNPIGIFDSGVGGLSVAFNMKKTLPKEKIIYIADTKRQPYGEKTKEKVINYSEQISDYLVQMQAKAIIIACSTATSVALTYLRQRHPDKLIIGLINDTFIDHTIQTTKTEKIGIIATTLTTKSQTFTTALLKKAPFLNVSSLACPELVDLISQGDTTSDNFLMQIEKDMKSLFANNIDTLILGCTHFALLKETFQLLYPKLNVISPPELTTLHLKSQLKEYGLLNQFIDEPKDHLFLSTGNQQHFSNVVQKITKETIGFKKLNLSSEILPLTA